MTGGFYEAARCGRCATVFTVPRPSDLGDAYPQGEYYAFRAVDPTAPERARWWAVARGAYRAIARREPGRLLDVGCGAGRFAAAWRRWGWEVHGLEPDPAGAEAARSTGLPVVVGTLADELPFAEQSFDAVIFNHSLEHTTAPVADLRRALELLRPGGLVGITVPNFASWQRRAFGADWFQLDMPRHVTHFEPDSLRHVVESAGFDVVAATTSNMMADLPLSIGNRARRPLPTTVAKLLGYASVAVLAPAGPFGQGDCLNLVGRRRG